ncbi:ABC transporter permease [Nibrella saemangeumensis]|uniref:ABC transporter permease n=1 Tax=Nibrella saemangeumensis TaxID=1084526 RepID=UPI0031EEF617
MVRRDFLVSYQQTILGPLWVLLQPIVTLLVYLLVFSKLVGVSTGSIPPILFYFSGIILWNFFSDSFIWVSSTFIHNSQVFSKVYFPRLVVPLSLVAGQFIRMLIQLGLLGLMVLYFKLFRQVPVQINAGLVLLSLFGITGLSLATGLLFAVLTAKYRDLANIVSLGVRMLMFVTPVLYPISVIPEQDRWMIYTNPLTPMFEAFRYGLFGEGDFTAMQLAGSIGGSGILLLAGMLLFNNQKEKLMDVV